MKTKNIKLHYIEFDTYKESCESKNYPHGGLFLVKVKVPSQSMIQFIDKSMPSFTFVASESAFMGSVKEAEEIEQSDPKPKASSDSMSSNDFILEFSKILLKR